MRHKVSWLMERSDDGRIMFYGLHEDPPDDETLSMTPALMEYLADRPTKDVEW